MHCFSNFSLHHFKTNTSLKFSFYVRFIFFSFKKAVVKLLTKIAWKLYFLYVWYYINRWRYFFQLLYLACPFYSLTDGNGHFIRLLALTNCSHCNPKVHNNKKIRLFSFFFTQVGNGKIVFIGWTLKVFSYFSQIQLPLSS